MSIKMPKKKLTPEQMMEAFENWKKSEEYEFIEKFQVARNDMASKEPIELGTDDINQDWQLFLTKLYELGVKLKVPGRKAKSKTIIPILTYWL